MHSEFQGTLEKYESESVSCSVVSDSATPCTVASQALPSMKFSRQEYWSGLPFPSPGVLPDPGMEPESLTSPALAGGFFTTSTTWGPLLDLSLLKGNIHIHIIFIF